MSLSYSITRVKASGTKKARKTTARNNRSGGGVGQSGIANHIGRSFQNTRRGRSTATVTKKGGCPGCGK